MLGLMIRKEITSHVLTLRFGVTFILFIVLIFASIYVSVGEYRRAGAEGAAQRRAGENQLADLLGEDDFRRRVNRFYVFGRLDAVPVAPLSWLAQGLQPGYPIAINTRPGESSDVNRGLTRNPLLGLLRVPDFVYIVSVVLSLLAILFMFDAVCGEKESGTLRLLLSNAVPRHTVLLGKWIGGYVVLIVPFLIATAGGVGYAWASGVFRPTGEELARTLLIVAVACLYIAVFFNVSLFLSTTTRRAPTALLLCLLVWVAFILVIPNLAPVTAKILLPTTSQRKIEEEKRAVDQDIRLLMDQLMLSGQVSYGKEMEQARERLMKERDRRKKKWDDFHDAERRAQLGLAGILGRLSPSASWTYGSASLANTGPTAAEQLHNGRQKTLVAMGKFINDLWRSRRNSPSGEWPAFTADEVPRLQVRAPEFAEAANGALNDALILVILNVAFFMLAFAFFVRYDGT